MAARPRDARLDQAIMEQARAHLHMVGYEDFTVEAVAAAAGVPKSTVYCRWPSRADLLSAVLTQALGTSTAPTDEDLQEVVGHIVRAEADLASSPAGHAIVHFVLSSTIRPTPASDRIRQAWQQRYRRHLTHLHAVGAGHPDPELARTLDLILGMVWGCSIWQRPARSELVAAPTALLAHQGK